MGSPQHTYYGPETDIFCPQIQKYICSMSHPYGRSNDRRLALVVQLIPRSSTDQSKCPVTMRITRTTIVARLLLPDVEHRPTRRRSDKRLILPIVTCTLPMNTATPKADLRTGGFSEYYILSCPYSLKPMQLGLLIWVLQLHFFCHDLCVCFIPTCLLSPSSNLIVMIIDLCIHQLN